MTADSGIFRTRHMSRRLLKRRLIGATARPAGLRLSGRTPASGATADCCGRPTTVRRLLTFRGRPRDSQATTDNPSDDRRNQKQGRNRGVWLDRLIFGHAGDDDPDVLALGVPGCRTVRSWSTHLPRAIDFGDSSPYRTTPTPDNWGKCGVPSARCASPSVAGSCGSGRRRNSGGPGLDRKLGRRAGLRRRDIPVLAHAPRRGGADWIRDTIFFG